MPMISEEYIKIHNSFLVPPIRVVSFLSLNHEKGLYILSKSIGEI